MSRARRPPPPVAAAPARPRASRARQRQRLIDACISALHVHGPSKTTVEKVVAIARMSPGIVRFYFDSKDAMLVASLEFLATEFEETLLVPVAALRARPVEALERLVELYLGSGLASTRKVSVWYAFWGEASSRQEYHDICGARDSKFEALVRDLVGQLIADTRSWHLDADAIALGLIGVLEMLWQGFAFQTESVIDRPEARRRAMAYLRSVFPTRFVRDAGEPRTLPSTAYTNADVFDAERRVLFRGAWEFAGLAGELAEPGDYLTVDGPGERALVVRTGSGALLAYRNACRHRPHALAIGRGHLDDGIRCPVHGLAYDLDGAPLAGTPGGALVRLDAAVVGGLVFVRAPGQGEAPALPEAAAAADALDLVPAPPREIDVAADWKVLVEQWLEREPASGSREARGRDGSGGRDPGGAGWSEARHAAIAGSRAGVAPRSGFVAPHQWIEVHPDGLLVLQALPVAAGRSRLRVFAYRLRTTDRACRALSFLAARRAMRRIRAEAGLAESVQRGIESPAYVPEAVADPPPALAQFRQTIARLLPGGAPNPGDYA